MKENSKLKQEFKDFFKEMKEVEKNGSLTFRKDGYWFSVEFPFDDINIEIDYKKKVFGIRADDNFWTVAYLPYKFRHLSLDFIASVLWGENHSYEITPNYPSVERKKWEGERYAERISLYDVEDLQKKRKEYDSGLAKFIHNKYVRLELLKLWDEDHPLYKELYNFKMKKRYGYIRRSNNYYSQRKLLHLGKGSRLYKLTKEEIKRYEVERKHVKEEHEKLYGKDDMRFPRLTELEKEISKKLNLFPVFVSKDSDEDIKKYNIYVYGEDNVIFK